MNLAHQADPHRRMMLAAGGAAVLRPVLAIGSLLAAAGVRARQDGQDEEASPAAAAAWIEEALATRGIEDRLNLSRFVEPVYYLTAPTSWKPNPDGPRLHAVTVPRGFVTDFASIPPVFYTVLRPDAEYAHAAIIHDYLYWEQSRPRDEADTIFRIAMQDLDVAPAVVATLHGAVKLFGRRAWAGNAELKRRGERRLLRRFPVRPTTRWADWKRDPAVFADL